ncbi:MAG: hypothetical protein IKS44_02070 [Bacteroidales bacterium]|nr:hypothetical protein [Bacteroidales bacterium]
MNRRLSILLVAVLMAAMSGCERKPSVAVQLHRFEKVLFETPASQLQGRLASAQGEFSSDLLNVHPDNPQYMEMVKGFVTDPTMREVYRLVDSTFGSMESESQQLGAALARAHELCPQVRYDKVYTYVSGLFDYNMRVGCNSHELIISLDQYILPYTEKFSYFNSPLYLVQQSRREYMVADCMTAIARQQIVLPERDLTLLDYMVAEGKAIYFAQQTLPGTPDSILLRYTAEQTEWMQRNEEKVWAYFLQNKLLYETDYMRFHNFIDDAPKTNAFRESCPRTTDYIGWRIVQRYVKATGATLQELFNEPDAQKILSASNYRPK